MYVLYLTDVVEVMHVQALYKVDDEMREMFFFRYVHLVLISHNTNQCYTITSQHTIQRM